MPAEILLDVAHGSYHRDDLAGAPHFSRSVAVTLLSKSPLHAWHEHPKLGGQREEEASDAMDNGSLLHGLLFGSGQEVAVIPCDNYRTKAAQDLRDAARAAGLIPVLLRTWEETQETAEKLRGRILSLGVPLAECATEATVLWEDDGVACKARFDLAVPTAGRIWDVKITSKLVPAAFVRGMPVYGLDVQAVAYEQALAAVRPELAGRCRLEFLLCESKPPFDVALIPVAESMRSLGDMRWRRALSIWRRCLESGAWPGYGRLAPAEAPPWALQDGMIQALAETSGEEPAWTKED